MSSEHVPRHLSNTAELTDEEFLAKYDFDAEPPVNFHGWQDARQQTAEEFRMALEYFLIHTSGTSFTILEMQKATGVHPRFVRNFLQKHPWVTATLLRNDGVVLRYVSHAPVPESTEFGDMEMDAIEASIKDPRTFQAREDFYLMSKRGLGGKKRKVIAHW